MLYGDQHIWGRGPLAQARTDWRSRASCQSLGPVQAERKRQALPNTAIELDAPDGLAVPLDPEVRDRFDGSEPAPKYRGHDSISPTTTRTPSRPIHSSGRLQNANPRGSSAL